MIELCICQFLSTNLQLQNPRIQRACAACGFASLQEQILDFEIAKQDVAGT